MTCDAAFAIWIRTGVKHVSSSHSGRKQKSALTAMVSVLWATSSSVG